MGKTYLILSVCIVFIFPPFIIRGSSRTELSRYVQYRKGECPPLADYCRCGLVRKQGKTCLFQVVFEADGSPVPGGAMYAATLGCSDNCKNNDPPASGEQEGVIILKGPKHHDIWPRIESLFPELNVRIKNYRTRFEGKQADEPHDRVRAEKAIVEVEKKIALVLLNGCVGYFYRQIPEDRCIPFENFVFNLERHSPDGATMETNNQFGVRLFIYRDCFINGSGDPSPEVFCASILHEMYHWQQENFGGGDSEIQHIIYELACTEKMRLNSFYIWILGANIAESEYFEPERKYWVPRFQKAWSGLDRAARKKLAGWAWSRGGVNDETPEDPSIRLLMYSRQGWFYDIWETLFKATELRIIRPMWKPIYKKK
jgi:hypothetical protein